jgi:hypothetical protein
MATSNEKPHSRNPNGKAYLKRLLNIMANNEQHQAIKDIVSNPLDKGI